ncbi:MAG: transcription termination/antitermination protein NusG [Anaerolineae bacterium]
MQENELDAENTVESDANGSESPLAESDPGGGSADPPSDVALREEERAESSGGGTSAETASPAAEIAELAKKTEQDALEEAGLTEADDDREWYVIHCYSGREQKVRQKLEGRVRSLGMEDKIFQVVVPTEDEMELRRGERRTVERRIFPGYLLVQMILDDESWYAVQDTPGVIGFVGMGDRPTPLRPAEVDGIIARMEAEAPKIKVSFEAGEKVRIIDGPFDGFIGMVDNIDMERATVHVMVSFFGRETPVELDFLQVERI